MKRILSSIALVLVLFSCKKETVQPISGSPTGVSHYAKSQINFTAIKQQPKIQVDGLFKGPDFKLTKVAPSMERIHAKTHFGSRNNDAALLLVFNGATVENTIWNTLSGRPIIEFPPSGLSQQMADKVFRENVQAYRNWELNITTDSSVWLQAPEARRQIVIYSADDIGFGAGVGGVAILGSMVYGMNIPALVFSANLGYDDRNTQVGVHEAGHTVMLLHQAVCEGGVVTDPYNPGNEMEAPYMGKSFYAKKLGRWWEGTREPDCIIQNDTLVISQFLKVR